MLFRFAFSFLPGPTGCGVVAACALLVATTAPASAQFGQIPGGEVTGGNALGGRNIGGATGERTAGTAGGTTAGGRTAGGRTAGGTRGTEMRSADEIFSDGVARQGAPEERQVGAANAATGATRGGMGGGRFGGGFGGMGGLRGMGGFGGMGGFNQFGGNQFGSQSQQLPAVRTRLISGLDALPPPPRAVGATVNTRLSSLQSNGRFAGVGVRMEGRTAILVGRVASEEDKRIARLMVRLEPGVSEIDNRLEVAAE